jgi:hypothetical protein
MLVRALFKRSEHYLAVPGHEVLPSVSDSQNSALCGCVALHAFVGLFLG